MDKDGEELKLSQLSDGEKCYITLVADIARKLAIANPVGDPLEGDGIVLVDEIDLHLHPKWQQTVVSRLKEVFPNIQFFLTTHSPIVASDADGAVFSVKNGLVSRQFTFGKLSSSILSSVFDIDMARSLYVQAIIDEAYQCLKENKEQEFKAKVNRLKELIGPDDSAITELYAENYRRSIARNYENDR